MTWKTLLPTLTNTVACSPQQIPVNRTGGRRATRKEKPRPRALGAGGATRQPDVSAEQAVREDSVHTRDSDLSGRSGFSSVTRPSPCEESGFEIQRYSYLYKNTKGASKCTMIWGHHLGYPATNRALTPLPESPCLSSCPLRPHPPGPEGSRTGLEAPAQAPRGGWITAALRAETGVRVNGGKAGLAPSCCYARRNPTMNTPLMKSYHVRKRGEGL